MASLRQNEVQALSNNTLEQTFSSGRDTSPRTDAAATAADMASDAVFTRTRGHSSPSGGCHEVTKEWTTRKENVLGVKRNMLQYNVRRGQYSQKMQALMPTVVTSGTTTWVGAYCYLLALCCRSYSRPKGQQNRLKLKQNRRFRKQV